MENSTSNKGADITRAILFICGVWFLLSLCNDELVIPPLGAVFGKFWKILGNSETVYDVFLTLERLVVAIVISSIGGISLGVLSGTVLPLKKTIKEVLKLFQIVPPVAILVMAIIWFGLNGTPAVFIVVASLIPLIALQVIDAIENIDVKLVEMGKVFQFSKWNMVRYIYLPAIEPALWSSLIVSLTIGAKLIVMGEVLCSVTGIGGRINESRENIDPAAVIAWTIIMMILYYTIEFFINLIKERNQFEKKEYFS